MSSLQLYSGVALLLSLTVAGCAGSPKYGDLAADASDMTEADSSILQASNTTAQPVLFTDKKSLQYDTGQMDPNIPETFSATNSGLRFRILRQSSGRKPRATDMVRVHYRGWLDNGKEFDSSYDGGTPAEFPLNGVVAGWTEGLQLIGVGGMIELWVPGRLGYGTAGKGNIPPNASLHFVVELIEIL